MTTIVISLDYDGCGDILFRKISSMRVSEQDKQAFGDRKTYFIRELSSRFTGKDIKTELYVGSCRQSVSFDRGLADQNQNGSCFGNYEMFAKSLGWKFRTLLYADVENAKPPGTAITDATLNSYIDDNVFNPDILDKAKIKIIQSQLDDVAKNHPNENVLFYFYDDKKIILDYLKKYLQIPPQISVALYHFNWRAGEFSWYASRYDNATEKRMAEQEAAILSRYSLINYKKPKENSDKNTQEVDPQCIRWHF